MTKTMTLVFSAFFSVWMVAPGAAQTTEAEGEEMAPKPMVELNLKDFLWEKRPIVVFADTDRDPAFIRQLELLDARKEALAERDVVILTDTDPATDAAPISELRERLRPRGFMLVLIGKDGDVKLRKPFPWSVRELSRAIDKMPMRQQEIRDRKAAASSTDG